MYINKPSATKIKAAERDNLCIILSTALNSADHENLVKYLYPCLDIRHFMIVTKKTFAFRHQPRRKHFGSGAAIGTKKTAGGLGGAVSLPAGPGQSPGGGPGAKPPEAP